MTTASEPAFLNEFGKLFIQAQVDPRNPTPDRAAQDFARYLRAARLYAGLSREGLAAKTGLTPALLVALELAALPADRLSWSQITSLALALGEQVELFAILLERDLPAPAPASLPRQLQRNWGSLVAYFGSPARALIALALGIMTLGSAILSAALGVAGVSFQNISLPAPGGGWRWLSGLAGLTGPPLWDLQQALYYAPLTLAIVLILVLPWLMLARHTLPARRAHWLHQRPNRLINSTTLAILMVTVLMSIRFEWGGLSQAKPIVGPERNSASVPIGPLIDIESSIAGTSTPLMANLSVVFDSVVDRWSVSEYRQASWHASPVASGRPRTSPPLFVNTPTTEQIGRAGLDAGLGAVLLVCQALAVVWLYVLMWKVVRRVGRWRQVRACAPAADSRLD